MEILFKLKIKTMIKANELRIGNYICNGLIPDEYYYKVLSIGQEEVEFEQIYCEGEESFEWLFKDNYCGIPLTEDWLLSFGFDIKKHKWLVATHKINTDFVLNNAHDGLLRFTPVWCKDYKPVVYVHQLQNLYFALTGEELILKEPNL